MLYKSILFSHKTLYSFNRDAVHIAYFMIALAIHWTNTNPTLHHDLVVPE